MNGSAAHDEVDEALPMLLAEEEAVEHLPESSKTPEGLAERSSVIAWALCGLLAVWILFREATVSASATYERPLIIYSYEESDDAYRNAQFMVQHGHHGYTDFLFVQRGPGRLRELAANLPRAQFRRVDAACNGWASIRQAVEEVRAGYDRFLFVNATVRGPFLPYWGNGEICWTDEYLRRLTQEVKLVSMTKECDPQAPAQAVWATDRRGLDALLRSPAFHCAKDAQFPSTVLSDVMRQHHYREDVMMLLSHSAASQEYSCSRNDTLDNRNYFSFDLHPLETFFVRPGSGFSAAGTSHYTEWTDMMKWSSSEACKRVYEGG